MSDPDDDINRMMILGGLVVIATVTIILVVAIGSVIGVLVGAP